MRKDENFSHGVDCNARSSWCGLKHSPQFAFEILHKIRQIQLSQPLFADKIFPSCALAMLVLLFWWEMAKHNHRKEHAWCENTVYSVMTITYTWLVILVDLIMSLKPACVWSTTPSLCTAEEAWESHRKLADLKRTRNSSALLKGSLNLFATLIAFWKLKAALFQVTRAFSNSLVCSVN